MNEDFFKTPRELIEELNKNYKPIRTQELSPKEIKEREEIISQPQNNGETKETKNRLE